MAPSNAHISSQLRQLVYYHLDNNLLDNALFVAGRLHALEPRNADTVHLLSLCYLRKGQYRMAYDYSRNIASRGSHLGCSYIFGQACYALGRHVEGASALERAGGSREVHNSWNKHSETTRRHLPDGPAIYCLLGKLYHAHGDIRRSVEYYSKAVQLNPFMWDAFTSLCDNGTNVKPSSIYRMNPQMISALGSSATVNPASEEKTSHQVPLQIQKNNSSKAAVATPTNNPVLNDTRTVNDDGNNLGATQLANKINGITAPRGLVTGSAFVETPTASGSFEEDDTMMRDVAGVQGISSRAPGPPDAPLRKPRSKQALSYNPDMEAPKFMPPPPKSRWNFEVETNEARMTGRTLTVNDTDKEAGETNRASHTATNHKRTVSGHQSQSTSSANSEPPLVPQRRSVRLFNQIRPTSNKQASAAGTLGTKEVRELKKARATGTRGRTASTSTVGRIVSGNRKPMGHVKPDGEESRAPSVANAFFATASQKHAIQPTASQPQPPPAADSVSGRSQEALQWVLNLFAALGNGYLALSRYRNQAALKCFDSIPSAQRETPWVLSQIGKAYYEQSSYRDAQKYFSRLRKLAPSRTENMEIYSTVLWHLKYDTELAHLSHELMDVDRLSPQAWCALGNSFSLQRDHDQAIKCFRRATQLDPSFAYAYTLQGHEHVANEEYDKALQAYRSAIASDHRHYNGWYGLGKVYEKLGKYDSAEEHYKSAAQINGTNAVLVVCIGQVLEKMDKLKSALVQYSHACDLDPRSALSRFKKARALMNLKYPREALDELLVLKDIAPDEANVHFNLGRLYGILGEKANAIRHYTIALNLDPKAGQYIKESMQALHEPVDVDYGDDDAML